MAQLAATRPAPSQEGEADMARQVTVALEDDLDGGPADQTVRVALNGADYEIDLTGQNATTFRQQLTPFIEHPPKAGRGPAGPAATRQRRTNSRAWAKEPATAA